MSWVKTKETPPLPPDFFQPVRHPMFLLGTVRRAGYILQARQWRRSGNVQLWNEDYKRFEDAEPAVRKTFKFQHE